MPTIAIAGSGVAGVILARELLGGGSDFDVTILEAGPSFTPGDYRIWLDRVMAGGDTYRSFIDDPRTEHDFFGLRGSRLIMKGGTTNHWGGLTPRLKPEDFELRSRTGYGADWPISYADLAPHYARAEVLLGISGDSDNDDPPRYGARYPFPPTDFTPGDLLVMAALDEHGISHGHMSLARDGNRCITTGTCDYCPVNARYTALYDLVRLQEEYPERLNLLTESPVTQVLMDGKRRARGVSYLDLATGATETLEADRVVVSAGTVESAKLLLASANSDWVDGIGNDSDHVGRHLIGHPVMFAEGVLPENPDGLAAELGFTSLISRHFDSPEYQSRGKMWFSGSIGATASIEDQVLSNASRADIDARARGEMRVSLGGEMEQFESPENRVRLGRGTTRHGLRTTEIEVVPHDVNLEMRQEYVDTFSEILRSMGCREDSIEGDGLNPDGAHASCTCRMSADEGTGVVTPDLQVHGTDNLYVCSNAVFASVGAANPTLTVAALAVRLAAYLRG